MSRPLNETHLTGQVAANDSQTHSIIGPLQLCVILSEIQAIRVSATSSAAALFPARSYFMILKKSNKTNYSWCSHPPLPSIPSPLTKTPAGIGPQNNKEQSVAKK